MFLPPFPPPFPADEVAAAPSAERPPAAFPKAGGLVKASRDTLLNDTV